MEHTKTLGIYISRQAAAAVLAGYEHGVFHAVKTVKVNAEKEPAERPLYDIALKIAEKIKAENLTFSEAFACVDSMEYSHHEIRSEFSDVRQIDSTVRFDAEETLATDASDLATAYNIIKTDESGSLVNLFSMLRPLAREVLEGLVAGGIEPTAIEPDINSIARYISIAESQADREKLFVIYENKTVCFIRPPEEGFAPSVRSFIADSSKNASEIIARNISLSTAVIDPDKTIRKILLWTDKDVNTDALSSCPGYEVELFNPEEFSRQSKESGLGMIAFAAAAGSALLSKDRFPADFRKDFAPYLGRKKAMEKTLQHLSAAATIILVSFAVMFQTRAARVSRDTERLKTKLNNAHIALTGSELKAGSFTSKFNRLLKGVQRETAGMEIGDDKSVPALLTFTLEAINKTPADTDLNIDSISISSTTVKLIGSTKSKGSTLLLFKAIDAHPKIKRTMYQSAQKGGRDTFTITIEPK